ncbi:FAD-binding and (Fe-S)-binding domain-containing protein [Helicobacter acinonychis]|uniref:FAD-binding and (Fe-S)-binding domain-containing protein n=1 Tax=Helicobacter acinonychis TaxID=212 RepID=UPI000CF174EF|nr:FAD-binding and (Fe-S)-binding domain-containing protein [Helicobacter acinonychis]STP05138.1 d-lactate dehydrogenase [Helicobacter acinonychis]
MEENYHAFFIEASKFLSERIFKDYLRRLAYGIDASCYRYIPKIVVWVKNEEEVQKLCILAQKHSVTLTFRAAGSSLSGQASCDGVLVVATHFFKDAHILDNAKSIKLACGVIGSNANALLKPYRKKIGPDPATINTAMIGGIVANNASGMCCGVEQNSYKTLKSLRVILMDGTLLDTANQESVESFKNTHKNLIEGVLNLRKEILKDRVLHALIKKKYEIKNTTGYSLNALIDFEDPIEIVSHLFIGSEGTLGFISSVELECVKDYAYKTCALLFYENLEQCTKAAQILAALKTKQPEMISSAELMDYASLKSVKNLEGMPSVILEIKEPNACLLIQSESDEIAILENNMQTILDALNTIPVVLDTQISNDPSIYQSWWKIRKGIFPIAASQRKSQSSVIIEDVCFSQEDFVEGTKAIEGLLKKHGFKDNSIIFGHALSGNLHFVVTPILENETERKAFEKLAYDMFLMVSKSSGSIKAEHGTGRMVAPFVEMEWGEKAYKIHKQIKALFDPKGILNPDVIITDDKEIHTKNLKSIYPIEEHLDMCMECGFCERICPSKDLSLTPRQRIVIHREIERLKERANQGYNEEQALLDELLKESEYLAHTTCAVCHMCSTLCPLGIDTGSIALNHYQTNPKGEKIASKILNHMQTTTSTARFSLKSAVVVQNLIGSNNLVSLTKKIKKFIKPFPKAFHYMPKNNAYALENKTLKSGEKVIYFSTCINRSFAPSTRMADKRSVQEVFESLCQKAKVSVMYPNELNALCCGKAFINYTQLTEQNNEKNHAIFLKLSDNGKIPIVLDHSACSTHFFKQMKAYKNLKVYDLSVYIEEVLSPKLKFNPINEDIGLYTMCALKLENKEELLLNLAKKCTLGEIVIHKETGCCAFAGNKGFFTPELNESALNGFKTFYQSYNLKRGFSTSSTCEIGLSEKTQFSWQHIAYLVDACTL